MVRSKEQIPERGFFFGSDGVTVWETVMLGFEKLLSQIGSVANQSVQKVY